MANKVYTTIRGRKIDMGALAAANAEKIAVGNAKMNARGDLLAKNGVVLRTQEQVEAEWRKNQQQQNDLIGISPDIRAPFQSDKFQMKPLQADHNFEPNTSSIPLEDTAQAEADNNAAQIKKIVQQRRKIVDTE